MRSAILAFLIFTTSGVYAQLVFDAQSKEKHLPISIRRQLSDMRLVYNTTSESDKLVFLQAVDSTPQVSLTYFNHPGPSTLLLCDHEVTNKEYREFVRYVVDSLMRDFLAMAGVEGYMKPEWEDGGYDGDKLIDKGYELEWKTKMDIHDEDVYAVIMTEFYIYEEGSYTGVLRTGNLVYWFWEICPVGLRPGYHIVDFKDHIYPDTLVWSREFNDQRLALPTNRYFWDRAYDDYPVVGITYDQAHAYCNWKRMQMEPLLVKFHLDSLIGNFRIATGAEWEYAAGANQIESINVNALAPLPVKSSEPGALGIYDMDGNVSELTSTMFTNGRSFIENEHVYAFNLVVTALHELLIEENWPDSVNTYEEIRHQFYEEDLRQCTRIDDIWDRASCEQRLTTPEYLGWLHEYAQRISDIITVIGPGGGQIIAKGGSWNSGTIPVTHDRITPAAKGSADVGFRVALEIKEEAIPYFLHR